MKQSWIIPDVHGAAKTLAALIAQISPSDGDELFFLGDLVDRGPDSKGVLDIVMDLMESKISTRVCMGNHELATIRSREDMVFYRSWLESFGGKETLISFGVDSIYEVPEKYLEFMASFEKYIALEELLLIHAGLDFSLDDPFVNETAFYHIRKYEVIPEKIGGRKLVHGHTPTKLVDIMLAIETGAARIPLDNGVVYTGSQMGNLLAYNPLTQVVTVQPYIG